MKSLLLILGFSLAIIELPTQALSQQHLTQESTPDTTSPVFEAILENLKTYSNIAGRERMLDRRVFVWQRSPSAGQRQSRFDGKHDSEMMDGFRLKGLIDGYAYPERQANLQSWFWLCDGNETEVAISLSSCKLTTEGQVSVLCRVDTISDIRRSGGIRLGFFAVIEFTLEYRDGMWKVVKREHIMIS